MNDTQENKTSSYDATDHVLTNNNAKWSGNALFVAARTAFSGKFTDLLDARQRQKDIITGITLDKKLLRRLMQLKAVSIGTKVSIFAEDTNNNELRDAVNLSFTKLDDARDEEVGGLCQNILNHANDNSVALALPPYNVAAGDLTDLGSAINAYNVKAQQPRAARAAKKAVTAQIVNLIKDIDKIFKNRLDKLIEDYKTPEFEFYTAYRTSRILINLGATHTKLRMTVKDENGVVITGALALLLQNNFVIYQKSSGANGKLVISKVKPGTFDLRVEKSGFTTKTETGILFKAGKEVGRTVTLVHGSSPGLITLVREGDVAPNSIANISLTGINTTGLTLVSVEVTLGPLSFFAAATPDGTPGPTQLNRPVGATAYAIADFVNAVGFGNGNNLLNVQNTGASTAHYKLTFSNLES